MTKTKLKIVEKGGPGSGHHGHRGRPGKVGGGLPDDAPAHDYNTVGPDTYDVKYVNAIKQHIKSQKIESYKYETNLQYLADEYGDSLESAKNHVMSLTEDMNEQLKSITSKGAVCVRVSQENLDNIFRDGKLRNQFETGDSAGLYDPYYRKRVESYYFGIDNEAQLGNRPIYGYVTDKAQVSDTAGSYGNVMLVLKDSVRTRTTVTGADSLNEYVGSDDSPTIIASMIDDPDWNSFAGIQSNYITGIDNRTFSERNEDSWNYMEAQIHGGVKLSDIDRIYIDATSIDNNVKWYRENYPNSADKGKTYAEIKDMFSAVGIKVYDYDNSELRSLQ